VNHFDFLLDASQMKHFMQTRHKMMWANEAFQGRCFPSSISTNGLPGKFPATFPVIHCPHEIHFLF
jgi:hypothetical protein